MRYALLVLAACAPAPIEPEAWQLDQDRVIAVRVTPPGIVAGEHATVDGLLAHAGGPTTVEVPSAITAAGSPLYTAVNYLFDHYEVIAPDDATLADARSQLGLAAGAPIPFPLAVFFGPLSGDHFNTHKDMWLGESDANPSLPALTIDGTPPAASLTLGLGRDIALGADSETVRWLSSCGTLRDSDEPNAILRVDDACDGELVVVVRDGRGGTVWQVWHLTAQ
ncbi:MAG: hypothetical protein ABI591_02505 [Kofleriaceae bacterium]